jgi:transposase
MGPYSTDLRERVIAAVDQHEGSIRRIAHTFRVDPSTITRWLQRRRQAGTLEPRPHGGGPPPALDEDDHRRLDELIQEQPDATLSELKRRGGFSCSLKTLWRAVRRRSLTFKKKSLHADQRDRPDVQSKRRAFRRKIRKIEPKRLVFVDETGITTAMTPAYAWAPRGARAVDSAPASWETTTLIAALGLEGVRAPLAFPGATDTAAFQTYVDRVLVPQLHPGDVVVFDNLKPHLSVGVSASIERAGAQVLPLPPYSPDYSPIEEMYSKVKQGLRRAKARVTDDLDKALGEVLGSVTSADILGWFRHAGLCATHG